MKVRYSMVVGMVLALCTGMVSAREEVAEKVLLPPSTVVKAERPEVKLETSMGTIVLALDAKKAPVTVENFLRYVKDGYYNGLIFHRVISGFMVQGGGMKPDMSSATPRSSITNESANGLSNKRGTIAMARTSAPDSATAQFFINEKDNMLLDGRPGKPGYAVFGHVVEGMNVVDAMSAVKTGRKGPHGDVPVTPIIIKRAEIVQAVAPAAKKPS